MILRKERIEFYIVMFVLLAAGWFGGFLVATPVLLVIGYLLWKAERYGDLLFGFLFILLLSDNLPEQFAALGFAKQLKSVFIVLLAGIFLVDRRKFEPVNPFIKKFIPFLIVACVALYASETITVSIQKTLSYILLLIVVPNYVTTAYRREGTEFFTRFIYYVVFILLLCVALKYLMPGVGLSHGARMRGIFGNPNGLGVFLVISMIMVSAIRQVHGNTINRFLFIGVYGLILICTLWTGSRTALLAIFLFLGFFQIFKISPVLGFIAFLGVAFYIQILIDMTLDLIIQLGLGEDLRIESLEEGSGRIIAWQFAWDHVQDYLYLGRGFGYDEFLMRSNFDYLSRMGHEGGVHNSYLIIWLNTGVIGLFLFLRGYFLYFYAASKNTRLAFPIMFTIMFSITFEPWIASSLNPYTGLFIAVLVMISQLEFYPETEENEEVDDKQMVPA